MFNYTKHQIWQIKTWKCLEKAICANKRFDDKISTNDVLNLLIRFDFKCGYCGIGLPTNWQLDHFYSRAMGGKNSIENLCPACKWCNQMKNALDGFAFLHRCHEISKNNLIEKMFGAVCK